MALRESVFNNLIGDLKYNPKRALLYIALSAAAISVWLVASTEDKFGLKQLVCGAGGLALLFKAIFLLRKSSDGLAKSKPTFDLSTPDPRHLSDHSIAKESTSLVLIGAQLIQDFAAGAILLGPILHFGSGLNESWPNLPSLPAFLTGLILFFVGWLLRRLVSAHALGS